MIKRTSSFLVPSLLCMMAFGCIVFSGCKREKKAVIVAPTPTEYMNDKDFRAKLDAQVAKRNALAKARNDLRKQMVAKIDAMKAKLPNASDDAIKTELEKDPEWNSLYKRMTDVNAAIEDNRKESTKIVHDRTAPKKVFK